MGDRTADAAAGRRHPDERIRWQHRPERAARVVGISPAIRHTPPDQPMGVPPPPRLWDHAYCRWQCRCLRGRRVPLIPRLQMGRLLPDSCGAESRGWLLVPHYRSLRICQNLILVRRPPFTTDELKITTLFARMSYALPYRSSIFLATSCCCSGNTCA